MQTTLSECQVCRVSLEGDWTVNAVADRIPWIARQSHLISEQALRFSETSPDTRIITEIDLHGITALDESGRRMLVMWLGHLDHRGFNPVIRHADAEYLQGIDWQFSSPVDEDCT
ncbi:hypothetical protein [Geobacter sp. AOG2]|uniref:hypothetical protein n=1 Tax=Geobacter sp. AOG2 TaxID=1566347 RepID=UPI001CC728A0|nr:hypothetical protein [Geobacter sp. AOG2]GFE60456.1 hypothetical protein AOG2_10440 [Geobacter sp. AOG2]